MRRRGRKLKKSTDWARSRVPSALLASRTSNDYVGESSYAARDFLTLSTLNKPVTSMTRLRLDAAYMRHPAL